MRLINSIITFILILFTIQAYGLKDTTQQSKKGERAILPERKYFIRAPYLNFIHSLGENVYMYEFHFGKQINSKEKIGIKIATWKLFEPMGIQLWEPLLMQKSEWYNGRIREYGIGAFYQRKLWKGLYASVEIMPMLKRFLDESNNEIEKGFRLYTSAHIGYHIAFLKNRFFIEPQIHCNYWPINSKGPSGFKEQEKKWDNYLLFEPNLYLGVKF